jgi:hypothetical protein
MHNQLPPTQAHRRPRYLYKVVSRDNLLDASQIVWFRDPDDDEPMAPATSSMAQPEVSATMLNSYVTKVPAARRSTCAPHPSTKVIDPDDIMALKRKPSNPAPNKPSFCPRHASPDHEVDEAIEPVTGTK